MRFIEFLGEANKKNSFIWDNKVICFVSDTYHVLFFRMVIDFLKNNKTVSLENFRASDKKQLWETLQQSFLGETSFYWLGDILSSIKKSKKKNEPDLIDVLSLYRGPHSIAFFANRDSKISSTVKNRMLVIDIQEKLNLNEIIKLFSFFGEKLSTSKLALLKDIVQNESIPLDLACMLINYLAVTSTRMGGELKRNLAALVEPQLSLYSLSQAFFRKQKKQFFSLWAEREGDYSTPFWVAYWSEQLWRAYYVVKFLKQDNFPAARRFAFRLPSSFIKADWRSCSMDDIKNAFEMLYDIDFAFKKGSTFCSLDLLYIKYFTARR